MSGQGTKLFDRRDLLACAGCGKGMMHANDIHFYEVSISQCVVDMNSVMQQHGLEMMLGSAAGLSPVLAPSTHVAHRLPPVRRLICATCSLTDDKPIAVLADGE